MVVCASGDSYETGLIVACCSSGALVRRRRALTIEPSPIQRLPIASRQPSLPRMPDADHKGSITIGEGVSVHGTIVATGRATVYGALDGEVTASEVLIGPDGRISGRLTAEIVDIYGDGPHEVTAYKSLTVRSSGKVSGTIQYARLEVEPGGELDGELVPLTDAALSAAGFPPAVVSGAVS